MSDDFTRPCAAYSVDCTGDVVRGDRIRFSEAVFGGSHRRPKFLGLRTIEAEVLTESYGADRQQHTFSLLVHASDGIDAPAPGKRIRRKGRNIYRRRCFRAPWEDETARRAAAAEKHRRGDAARAVRKQRREIEQELSW